MMHEPYTYSEYFASYDAGPALPVSPAWLLGIAPPCSWCGERLDIQEVAGPYTDDCGEPICDDTYHEEFQFICHWCENYEDKDRECAVGSLFAIFEPVPAQKPIRFHGGKAVPIPVWYDENQGEMLPGIYRVTKWPMHGDDMLSGWLYADAFERIRDLTEEMQTNGGYAEYPCGPLCRECEKKLTNEPVASG